MNGLKDIDSKDFVYWQNLYDELRNNGWFKRADELREMIRRMGYDIKIDSDKKSHFNSL